MKNDSLSIAEIEMLHLAYSLKEQGQLDSAIQTLQALIEQNPEAASAYNNLGAIHYANKSFPDAINAYKTAINLQPNYPDAYYNLGLAYIKAGFIEEAVNAYTALVALAPHHLGGLFQLGCLLMRQHKHNEAAQLFAAVLALDAEHVESLMNLAACLLMQGDYRQSQSCYLRALTLMPDDIQILFNLGVISERLGQMQDAVDYYLKVLAISPDFFGAHNNLGVIFHSLPESDRALMHLRAALAIQPDNLAVQHSIDILTQNKNITHSPPAYIQSLFDAYADRYDAHLQQSLHYQVPALMFDLVKKQIQTPDYQGHILDLGCGTGLCGQYFRSLASTLIGVDLSEKMLAVAAEKKLYDELIHADITAALAGRQSTANMVLAGDVLVYIGDLSPVFAAITSSLRPAGLFAFNVECGEEADYKMTPSGRFAHSKAYIERLAAENGLKLCQMEQVTLRTENGRPILGYLYLLQN